MAGFQETPQNVIVRSQVDSGPAKTRRRTTAGVINLEMQFRMTTAQLITFRAFYLTDLQAGALSYTWKHPITGVNGAFRMVEPPRMAPAGASWLVGVKAEMLP